ncbi:MAG: MMPL family transporter [Deltaproteobacteria bacterium]|nr:MMPL family transporter [Deltaproteobacteria bacterium]
MSRFLNRLSSFILSHPVAVIIFFSIVTTVALFWLKVATPLKLDTNFTTLLPDDLPCVVESKRISKLVGSTDYLYVAISSPNVKDNLEFADEIAKRLKKLPYIDWVTTKEDKSYFRKRRLLYLDTPDLAKILERAEERVAYEKKIANPFYINLDNEEPPDISFDDIMSKYEKRLSNYGIKGILGSTAKNLEAENSDKKSSGKKGESLPELSDYITSEDGHLVTVMARPSKSAVNMDFGRMLVDKTKELIIESNPDRNSKMDVQVAGAYRNRYLEYNNIVKDIFSSLTVSALLIFLIIVVFFRRASALVMVLFPLFVGTIMTAALAALTVGRLNLVTALIFAILLGLGIDFGVHMTSRYLNERSKGNSLAKSIQQSLVMTGRAVLTAGLTTAGGLGILAFAEFKGFSEFGIIATLGILSCLISYIFLVPALASILEKFFKPKPVKFFKTQKTLNLKPPSSVKVYLISGTVILITLASIWFSTRVGFEYNFNNLGSKTKVSCPIKYGKTLSQSASPVVALLDTPEQAKKMTRYFEDYLNSDKNSDGLLKNAFSIFSFVPEDQNAKLVILKKLQIIIDDALNIKKLKTDTKKQLESIREWTSATSIQAKDLPEWVKGKFTQKDGTIGTMVYLFPNLSEFHTDQMSLFYDKFGLIDVPGVGKVRPAASGFILVEVIRAVQRDGIFMTIAAVIVVFLILISDFRSIKRALLVITPLLVGLLWTTGIMGLTNIKLGLYNMLMMPMLLGIGVDASVHFYHSYLENGKGSLPYVLKTAGMAVLVASVTTGVGFAGMLIVSHNGLRSIGTLAVIGISASLAGSISAIYAMLLFNEYRQSKSGKQKSD